MRARAMTVGLIAMVTLVAGLPATTAGAVAVTATLPAEMPGDRLIASEPVSGSFELASYERDGSGRIELTSGEADFAPVWSPDGQRVAFQRVGTPATDLWVVEADGTDERRLAQPGTNPDWSPDGSEIVFSTAFEGDPGPLRIAAVDGSGVRSVPNTAGAVDPVWSPDGGLLAYVHIGAGGATVEVRTIRPDGNGRRTVAPEGRGVRWSPDGAWLAMVQGDGTEDGSAGNDELVLVSRDGIQRRVAATGFRWISQLQWSPDGQRLAFSGIRATRGPRDIWVVVADGTGLTPLTQTVTDDFGPSWSASGRHIGFTRTPDISVGDVPRDIWTVDAVTGGESRVTDTGSSYMAAFAPGRGLRLAGPERIATAAALSRAIGGTGPVVIARADDYPDALAGAPLAVAVDGPILLTGRNALHPAAEAEVRRREAATAYLLGGTAALSDQVEADLRAAGVDEIVRLAGADRFATAARVAAEVVTLTGEDGTAYLVEGGHADPSRGWPDAVSVSGLAAFDGRPVLLVLRDRLPEATAEALADLGIERAVLVGGPAAISEAVEDEVAGPGVETDRLSGATRFETSVAVAEAAVAAGADAARTWLATGRNWPDALAAGAAAARDGGVLALVDGHSLAGSPPTREWLSDNRCGDRIVYVGGVAVLRPPAVTQVEAAARC